MNSACYVLKERIISIREERDLINPGRSHKNTHQLLRYYPSVDTFGRARPIGLDTSLLATHQALQYSRLNAQLSNPMRILGLNDQPTSNYSPSRPRYIKVSQRGCSKSQSYSNNFKRLFLVTMDGIEKQQFYKHIRCLSQIIEDGDLSGAVAAKTLLTLWSKHLSPNLSCGFSGFSHHFAANPKVKLFFKWLCDREFLNAAYWISSAYSIWTGKVRQKQLAMFFTPPSLTKRLLDDLEIAGASFLSNSFLDPACGGAAFLASIALRMKTKLREDGKSPRQIIVHIEKNLFGIEIESVLCALSKHFLRMVLAEEIFLTKIEPQFNIVQFDSLEIDSFPFKNVDVVVCNPPYRKLLAAEVSKYRKHFDNIITAQPNIYGLFIALCLRILKPNGIAALITPTSFMSGQYFAKLRNHLMENSEIIHIGIVSERQGVFIDVEQQTALTILRQKNKEHSNGVNVNVAVVSGKGDYRSVGSCALPNSGSAWPIPRIESDVELIRLMSRSGYRLSDYGYTAKIGMFVWNRDPRSTYFSWEDAIADKAQFPLPLLWSSDVRKNGKFSFLDGDKKNIEPAFVDIADSAHRAIIKNPSILIQRVTSNDQKLRLIAAKVPPRIFREYGGFIAENHTVILEAKNQKPSFPIDNLVQLLSTYSIERYFRCISGTNSISLFELSQIPLPAPDKLLANIRSGISFDAAVLRAYKNKNL